MNANAQSWLQALRGGEYLQGKGSLVSGSGDTRRFCCLGVLCELAAKAGVEGAWPQEVDKRGAGIVDPLKTDYVPEPVRIWAGLKGGKRYSGTDNRYTSLTHYNDGKGWSFQDIADHIQLKEELYFIPEENNVTSKEN